MVLQLVTRHNIVVVSLFSIHTECSVARQESCSVPDCDDGSSRQRLVPPAATWPRHPAPAAAVCLLSKSSGHQLQCLGHGATNYQGSGREEWDPGVVGRNGSLKGSGPQIC